MSLFNSKEQIDLKKLRNLSLLIFVFALLFQDILYAEYDYTLDTNATKTKYGIFANYGMTSHIADFQKLQGYPNCCLGFRSTNAFNPELGILLEANLDLENRLSFRLSFASFDAKFRESESETVLVDGKEAIGTFEHRLDASFSELSLQALYNKRLTGDLFVAAGINVGFLLNKTFHQSEVLVEPATRGTFKDETRIRNEFSGDIKSSQDFQLALELGLNYEFPINRKKFVFLAPELNFKYFFTPMVQSTNWNRMIINLGLALKYRTPPTPPPPPPPPPDPKFIYELPIPEKPPITSASLLAIEVDENGNPKQSVGIKIEDFVSLNVRPLLNYVFFEQNSSVLPSRYKVYTAQETETFNLKSLQQLDAMKTYYQVLNIFGKRLQDHPKVKIKIVGCNSNIDSEKGNLELSKARATTVFNYFKDVWKISEDRMKIEARNLPDQESKSDTISGQQENMRVEIQTQDEEMTEPVMTIDTLRVLNPTNIRFIPKVKSITGIDKWRIFAEQDSKVLFDQSGQGMPPSKIDWKINNEDANTPRSSSPLNYVLQIVDSLGQSVNTSPEVYPIEQLTVDRKRLERQEDKEFEYYSLILFDYGKSNLGSEHKKVVDFVKNRITKTAKVYIQGFSDSMGNEEVNLKISESRAKAVAKRLGLDQATVEGKGESELLYDNSLPEGRFYCRTVKITVETTVKDN